MKKYCHKCGNDFKCAMRYCNNESEITYTIGLYGFLCDFNVCKECYEKLIKFE